MKTRYTILVAGLLALPTMCFAQGSRPGSGLTPSSNPGPTSAPIDPTKYTNVGWEEAYNKGRTGDQLRGNVTLAEGTLPWEPIPVIVTCEGNSSYSTKTNPQGIFVITRVEPVGSTTIIGTQKSLVTQLVGCAVSAVLPGFDSSKLTIINRDVRTNPNIGTITLKREEGAEYAAVSATTATAPKEARKMFEKARKEWLDSKPDRARRDLEKAVEICRQFAEAWYQLGHGIPLRMQSLQIRNLRFPTSRWPRCLRQAKSGKSSLRKPNSRWNAIPGYAGTVVLQRAGKLSAEEAGRGRSQRQ